MKAIHRSLRMLFGSALALLLVQPLAAAEVLKSPSDTRSYEAFRLPNRMQVLLISDPATDKAAAALDVNVGSGADPAHRQGLAHFLEHMLFLGTEKYPEPGEYHAFISEHGGSNNAYTDFEHTNYFFDVDKDHLLPALERFGEFFVSPLFNAEYVAREMHAVDSEYQSKRKSDAWRSVFALKQALNPEHPYTGFAVGSLETLADREDAPVREDLLEFYRRHYSANLMALVVVGKEPLPTLREWVTRIFSRVPNRDAEPTAVKVPLVAPGALPARLDVEPIKDERTLDLSFPVPPVEAHWREKPLYYLSHLLGHEGEGSLLSLLKEKGLAERVSAGRELSNSDAALATVSISLTREGLARVEEVASDVFQYIRLAGERGIEKWRFEEMAKLARARFRFQEMHSPIETASSLARSLHLYPAEQVLRAPYALDAFDPALIRDYLARFTPDNVLVTVTAKGLPTDAVEPRFGAAYRLAALDEATVARWREVRPDARLAMPEPNPFVPDDVSLKALAAPAGHPVRIVERAGLTLWHQQDATFRLPRADFYFSVRSPLANDSPRHTALTELYVAAVEDALNEFAYPAELAGLDFDVYRHIRGVSVRVSGYDDKQPLLVERIAGTLAEPGFSDARFATLKDRLMRRLADAREESPYAQAMRELSRLLLEPNWAPDERLAALRPLGPEDLRRFVPELLGRVSVVALAHGNVRPAEAEALAGILGRRLLAGSEPVEVPPGRVVRLARGEEAGMGVAVDHADSAIAVYLQGGSRSDAERARMELLAQVLESPFFESLRTEQRLGYLVFATAMPLLEVPGMALVVQSPRLDPRALEQRIEAFLQGFAQRLGEIDEASFATHRRAVVADILEREEKLKDRTDRYWQEIDREEYGFDSRERLAAAVEAVSRADLIEYYRRSVLGPDQRRLVTYSVGSAHGAQFAAHEGPWPAAPIEDALAFKQSRPVFGAEGRGEEPVAGPSAPDAAAVRSRAQPLPSSPMTSLTVPAFSR